MRTFGVKGLWLLHSGSISEEMNAKIWMPSLSWCKGSCSDSVEEAEQYNYWEKSCYVTCHVLRQRWQGVWCSRLFALRS